MYVIRDTADAHEVGTEVTADCGQIGVHARPRTVSQADLVER